MRLYRLTSECVAKPLLSHLVTTAAWQHRGKNVLDLHLQTNGRLQQYSLQQILLRTQDVAAHQCYYLDSMHQKRHGRVLNVVQPKVPCSNNHPTVHEANVWQTHLSRRVICNSNTDWLILLDCQQYIRCISPQNVHLFTCGFITGKRTNLVPALPVLESEAQFLVPLLKDPQAGTVAKTKLRHSLCTSDTLYKCTLMMIDGHVTDIHLDVWLGRWMPVMVMVSMVVRRLVAATAAWCPGSCTACCTASLWCFAVVCRPLTAAADYSTIPTAEV